MYSLYHLCSPLPCTNHPSQPASLSLYIHTRAHTYSLAPGPQLRLRRFALPKPTRPALEVSSPCRPSQRLPQNPAIAQPFPLPSQETCRHTHRFLPHSFPQRYPLLLLSPQTHLLLAPAPQKASSFLFSHRDARCHRSRVPGGHGARAAHAALFPRGSGPALAQPSFIKLPAMPEIQALTHAWLKAQLKHSQSEEVLPAGEIEPLG